MWVAAILRIFTPAIFIVTTAITDTQKPSNTNKHMNKYTDKKKQQQQQKHRSVGLSYSSLTVSGAAGCANCTVATGAPDPGVAHLPPSGGRAPGLSSPGRGQQRRAAEILRWNRSCLHCTRPSRSTQPQPRPRRFSALFGVFRRGLGLNHSFRPPSAQNEQKQT